MIDSKTLGSIGLGFDIIGAFLVGIEFIRKPIIEKELENALVKLKQIYRYLTMSGLLKALQTYLGELKKTTGQDEEIVVIENIIQKIKDIEKQFFGKWGLIFLILGFILQIVAIWIT